jgi:hypothetical protein
LLAAVHQSDAMQTQPLDARPPLGWNRMDEMVAGAGQRHLGNRDPAGRDAQEGAGTVGAVDHHPARVARPRAERQPGAFEREACRVADGVLAGAEPHRRARWRAAQDRRQALCLRWADVDDPPARRGERAARSRPRRGRR